MQITSPKAVAELANVHSVIISQISSGLSLFNVSLTDEEIEPDLFSALLTAIVLARSQSNPEFHSKQHLTLRIDDMTSTICYGTYLAGIIISKRDIDDIILLRLQRFIEYFETEFEFILNNWQGDRTFFDHEWASQQLLDFLTTKKERTTYSLHPRALRLASNAKQIRMIQLIRRLAINNLFNLEEICTQISKELDIPLEFVIDQFSELEKVNILQPQKIN